MQQTIKGLFSFAQLQEHNMSMQYYFKERTIWITGASSGIGEELAYQTSAMGAHLIISARRENELERVKAACKAAASVMIVPMDLSDEQSVRKAASTVLSQVKNVDVLFNNGGISQRALTMETSQEVVRKMFEVNFFSNVLLSQLVAKRMIENKTGHIVVTSSLMGKWGFYLRSTYAATKHALHGFYDSMRMEIEKDNVFITILTPGFINTNVSRNALNEKGETTGEMDNNQAQGMSAEECVRVVLKGVAEKKFEVAAGGRELMGLKLKRFFPMMFEKVLRKRSAK